MKSIYSKLLSLTLLVLTFAGCQNNDIDSVFIPEGNGFTLVATTASQTRVSLSDNSWEQSIEVTWAGSDSFSLYNSEGAYVARFYYTGEVGQATGNFVAEGVVYLTDGQSYTAIYPYLDGDEGRSLTEREAVALNITTQSEDASLEHTANELRMSADFSYTDSDSAMSINFAHDFSMLKVSFALEEGVTPTQLIFSDGQTPYTLLYGDDYTYTSAYTSYMVIAPSPENSGERTLNFNLTTSSGEAQEYSTLATNDLVAGKCYIANITSFTPAGALTLADFSAENYPADSDEWTIWNTSATLEEFYGLRSALYSADSEGREISIIFPNLEEVPTSSLYSSGAFYNCDALTSVEFPVVTSIGDYAFQSCDELTSVEFPVATSIYVQAFYDCDALTSVELPAATSIGSLAFAYCDALTSVELPVATSIGSSAFFACYALTSIELPVATSIGSSAFFACYALTSIELPAATSIGNNALSSCSALTSVELPVATSIGSYAFQSCNALTSLSIATDDNVVINSISSSAFTDTTTTDITLTLGSANSDYVSGNTLTVGDFSTEFKYILLADGDGVVETPSFAMNLADFSAESYPTDSDEWIIWDYTAPTAVYFDGLSAAIQALAESGRQISLKFPNLDSFPDYAIYGKTEYDSSYLFDALVSVSADVATSVGWCAFRDCSALIRVELPNVTTIEWAAFYECGALTTVEAPKTTAIESAAFYYCSNMSAIDFPNVTTIGEDAFYACVTLTEVSLPATTTIGSHAFSFCTAVTSFNLPVATSIGEWGLSSCDALTAIELPKVTTLNKGLFDCCDLLESVKAPKAEVIWWYAFRKCYKLSTVELDAATWVGSEAFYDCDALVSIALPLAITIQSEAFYHCSYLTTADLPSATTVGDNTFGSCKALTSLSLATKQGVVLESIDNNAFADTTLTDVTLSLSAANSEFVDGNILTIGTFSNRFKEIILVDGDVDAEYVGFTTLADFSATSYPTSTDVWTITDTLAETADFAGLSAALNALANSGREISLEFPNLQTIPSYAIFGSSNGMSDFASDALVSVTAAVATKVDGYAFYGCKALKTIEFPKATIISNSAFYDCDALTSVVLPAATEIGNSTFAWCDALTSIELATDNNSVVSSIDSSAFANTDTSLISLTLGSANSDYVSGNTLIINWNGWTFKEIILVDGDDEGLKTYTTLADFSADSYPADSDTWTITDTSAELDAFYGLRSALYSADSEGREISLIFPNLEEVPTSSSYSYTSGAFYDCSALTSIEFPVATEIGDDAFRSCDALTTIKLPVATEIGECAFGFCYILTSVELPAATSIGGWVFYSCDALTSVELPAATSIGEYALGNCSVLTSLSIATDDNVMISSIYNNAFNNNMTTTDITLTLGSANSDYVSGNTLTLGDFSAEFKEIIMVDGDGNVVVPDVPDAGGSVADAVITSCDDDLTFVISSCEESVNGIKVNFMVTNNGSASESLTLYASNSYAFDDQGSYNTLYNVCLGSSSNTSYVSQSIDSGASVEGYIIVEDVSSLASKLEYMTVKTGYGYNLIIKNLPIAGRSASALPAPTTTGSVVSCSDDIDFEILSCQSVTSGMKVSYRMKNTSSSLVDFTHYVNNSYAYDDRGTYYSLKYVSLGDMSTSSSYKELYLPPNVYVNGYFIIEGVSDLSATFNYISLKTNFTEQVVMKNVDIEGVEATALPSATTSGAVTSCSDDIEFELLGCQSSTAGMKVSYRMKNTSSSLVYFTHYVNSSYAYDDRGTYYSLKYVSLGDMSTSSSYKELYLPPNVYVNGYFIIEGVSDLSATFDYISLKTNFTERVVMKNVDIEGVEATALPSATTSGAVTSCSDDIEFEVLSCQSSVSGMKLSYRMKNVSSSLVYFTQYVNSSYVYDNEGNYCAVKSVSLGDMSTSTSYKELYLPPGVYVNGYVIIDGVSDSATELTSGSFRTNFTNNITIANIAIE